MVRTKNTKILREEERERKKIKEQKHKEQVCCHFNLCKLNLLWCHCQSVCKFIC